MEADGLFDKVELDTAEVLEPAVFLGKVASKEMVPIESPDYYISPEGYIGFNVRTLAQIALANGRDALIWMRPVRLYTEQEDGMEQKKEGGPITLAGGAVVIDSMRHELLVDDQAMEVPNQEFKVLQYLADNEGIVVTRGQILERCWGSWYSSDKIVDVNICCIRKKLGEYRTLIKTKHGIGFLLSDIESERNP